MSSSLSIWPLILQIHNSLSETIMKYLDYGSEQQALATFLCNIHECFTNLSMQHGTMIYGWLLKCVKVTAAPIVL